MGRKADFRNTIVLITSNLGARFLAGQSAPLGFAAGSEAVFEKQAAQAVEEAKKWFRPELVGRLDELIVFRPLSDESMSAIAEKMLCRLEVRAARSGYQLRHTPQVGPCWRPVPARPMERGNCADRWTERWNSAGRSDRCRDCLHRAALDCGLYGRGHHCPPAGRDGDPLIPGRE